MSAMSDERKFAVAHSSQIVALLTLRRVNQRGAGHSLFLFLVVDWLSKFYQNRSSKMSVLHQQDSLK